VAVKFFGGLCAAFPALVDNGSSAERVDGVAPVQADQIAHLAELSVECFLVYRLRRVEGAALI
jgi:hypothetical protein